MEKKPDSAQIVLGRLDDNRAQQLREKMKEIDFRKQDYDRVYHIQYDEFKLHNSRFGGNKEGMEPMQYNQWLDKELQAFATDLEKEQKEALKELEPEKKEKPDVYGALEEKYGPLEEWDSGPMDRRFGFYEQIDDMLEDKRSPEMDKDDYEPEKDDYYDDY